MLLEDFGALVGLLLALVGVSLTIITGDAVWDGIGTVGIGVLLATVAATIDAAEVSIRAAVPAARVIYLEPDLDRAALTG